MQHVWELLTQSEQGPDGQNPAVDAYFNHARTELVDLIKRPPVLVLDIGCGAGATGAELKRRFPTATVCGVELSRGAADVAATRIDRVLNANVETLDFAAAGFIEGSIDLVFFPDVLEHLYNPWNLLKRLRPFLAANVHVIASIPNVRNIALMANLMNGNWDYVPAGLLDVTHIRFFTKKSIVDMFAQTGYEVASLGAVIDGRIPPVEIEAGTRVDISAGNLVFRQVSLEDLTELRTIQFLVDAVLAS